MDDHNLILISKIAKLFKYILRAAGSVCGVNCELPEKERDYG